MHSAIKYLGGHSDLTARTLMGARALLNPAWNWRKNLGQMPAPETGALLACGLRSLAVRVNQQSPSALVVARAIDADPRVARLLYPGLPSCPGHALAARQMSGFVGMLTIEIAGDGAWATAVSDRF